MKKTISTTGNLIRLRSSMWRKVQGREKIAQAANIHTKRSNTIKTALYLYV
jgi:hypothetical protein